MEVLQLFNSKNKMKMSDELLEIYEPFRNVNIGHRYINPDDIIGFSLTENDILTSGKLQDLQEKIDEKGWLPKHLSDFELILLPNGKFTVGNGGNHRAYLSKKLKISSVPANIDVLIPEKNISESTYIQIQELEQEKSEINNRTKLLTKFLKSQGNKRSLFETEEETLVSLYNECEQQERIINKFLIFEAKKLGYLSDALFESEQF